LKKLISEGEPEQIFAEFKEIGRGGLSFGVYKATDTRTQNQVAIKMIRLNARNFKYVLPEILNHKNLHHPNVVDFVDAF